MKYGDKNGQWDKTARRSTAWWAAKKDAHSIIVSEAQELGHVYEGLHARFARNLSAYSMRPVVDLSPDAFYETGSGTRPLGGAYSAGGSESIHFNATRSLVATSVATICNSRPMPRFSTSEGGRQKRRECKRLEMLVRGIYRKEDVHKKAAKAWIGSCLTGVGYLAVSYQTTERSGRKIANILVEVVFPWEVYVDPTDAYYGKPSVWYRTETLPKERAIRKYARTGDQSKDKEIIRTIQNSSEAVFTDHTQQVSSYHRVDTVTLVHAWRLPLARGEDGGFHAIAATGGMVSDCSPWLYDAPPIVPIYYSVPPIGFHGDSLVDEAMPMQIEMNDMVSRRSHYQSVVGRPIVKRLIGSKTTKNTAFRDHEIPIIGVQSMGDVEIQMQPSTNPSWDRDIEGIYQKMFELTGLNQASAQGQTEPGVTAGVAQREARKTANIRQSAQQSNYDFSVGRELALRILECAEMAVEQGDCDDVEAPAEMRRRRSSFTERIKWGEISASLEDLEVSLSPGSALPDDPAAKMQQLTEWLQMGAISSDEYLMLSSIPDIEDARSLKVSGDEAILADMDSIIESGEYRAPEPFINPAKGIEIANAILMASRNEGEEEDRLDMIRQYIAACKSLLDAQNAALAGPALPQGGPALGEVEAPVAPGLSPSEGALMPESGPVV